MFDVIIIGGGPAGLTAAIYAQRAGLRSLVYHASAPGGQASSAHWMENVPGFPEGVGGMELGERLAGQAKRLGAELRAQTVQSVSLHGDEKQIVTQEGTETARAVILALGANPRELGIPGEKELRGMGVGYCATCDGFFFRDMDVCVVGGGDTALGDAVFLAKMCKSVTVIHRRDTFRAAKLSIEQAEKLDNVRFVMDTIPVAIEGKTEVTGLLVENKKTGERHTIPCAGVFIAVGNIPDTKMLEGQVQLDANGYILTDESLQTNVPGVYAAGDVRQTPLRQVVTACADGALAAVVAEERLHQS